MGKDRCIRIAVVVLGLLALFLAGAGDRAYAVSSVQTTTLTSGQVPTATQWNTYLNRAESWINSNLLGGGTTFTFAEGESLAVLGTLKVDSLRITGFIDLAAHIIPRISRTYRIGSPTFLLSALHVDTARIVNGVIDSLSGAVVTTSTFTATPATNSTGRLGSNGKRFASVNVDTVRHTVAFDSNDVSKIAPSDVDTANTAWKWGYQNIQVNSIDSFKVRASSISGSNLVPVLDGAKTWTGTQTMTNAPRLPDTALVFASDLNTGMLRLGPDSLGIVTGGKPDVKYGAGGVKIVINHTTLSDFEALRINQGGSPQYYWSFTSDVDAGNLIVGGNDASFSLVLNPTYGLVKTGNIVPHATQTYDLGSVAASWDSLFIHHAAVVGDIPYLDTQDDVALIKGIRKSSITDSITGLVRVDDATLPKEILYLHSTAGLDTLVTDKKFRTDVIVKTRQDTVTKAPLLVKTVRDTTFKQVLVSANTTIRAYQKGDPVLTPDGKPFFLVENAVGLLFGAVKQLDADRSNLTAWVKALQDSLAYERSRIDDLRLRVEKLETR